MASSRTEELVRDIARAYEAALGELEGTDLAAVQGRLDDVDRLTQELQALQDQQGEDVDSADPKWALRVQELHSQLCSVVAGAKSLMGTQLKQAGDGRRALKGYGGKGTATGRYHRSVT